MTKIPNNGMLKRSKTAILQFMKNSGMFALARAKSRAGIRILCYHGVWRGTDAFAGDSMFMLGRTFESRLALLRRLNFNVISLDQAVSALRGGGPLPPDCVVITIDDGWYSTFAHMLPALKHQGMHATVYCDTNNLMSGLPVPHVMAQYLRQIYAAAAELPPDAKTAFSRANDLAADHESRYSAALEFAGKLGIEISPYLTRRVFAYMTQDEIMQASRDGFAIELHAHTHSLGDFSFGAIAEEISINRQVLGSLLKQPAEHFRHFCYPSGKAIPSAADALRRLGIVSATTLKSGIAHRGTDLFFLPRIVDGDHLSELAFEAELCGVGDFLRAARAPFASFFPGHSVGGAKLYSHSGS